MMLFLIGLELQPEKLWGVRYLAAVRVREIFTATARRCLIDASGGSIGSTGHVSGRCGAVRYEYRHELESDIDPFKGLWAEPLLIMTPHCRADGPTAASQRLSHRRTVLFRAHDLAMLDRMQEAWEQGGLLGPRFIEGVRAHSEQLATLIATESSDQSGPTRQEELV